MPFTKGQSGNPNGRPKKGRTLTEEIERVLRGKGPGGRPNKALFAERVVQLAIEGNVAAANLVLSYIDGKPLQAIDLTTEGSVRVKVIKGVDPDAL
jgi:hypothetical protein